MYLIINAKFLKDYSGKIRDYYILGQSQGIYLPASIKIWVLGLEYRLIVEREHNADVSEMSENEGAAICCTELEMHRSFKLPDHCSIFAIKEAADTTWNQAANRADKNLIDSHAVIEALLGYNKYSITVAYSKEAIRRLTSA